MILFMASKRPDSFVLYATQRPSGENCPLISSNGVLAIASGFRSHKHDGHRILLLAPGDFGLHVLCRTAIILDLIMRIAIDIRKINEFGVGTYIWNLVRNIAAIDSHNEYLLIGSHRNFHELGPLSPNFRQLYQPEDDGFWRNNVVIPLALRRENVDVLHVPHHHAPFVA